MTVAFRVFGVPRPQGSKRAFVRGTKAIQVESAGEGLKTWRGQVAIAALEARPSSPIEDAVALTVTFYLPMPKKPRWRFPAKVPDLSKLVRGLEDELSGVIVTDDKLIVNLNAAKRWASEANPPGAAVCIDRIDR
jgi:Holliday junction resolvase RusA-like endonuclease